MRKTILAVAAILAAAGPAIASDASDVMVQVRNFAEGDNKAAMAACAGETSIVDEFPPHEWHGAGACTQWASDYDAYNKKSGITDVALKLSKPWHVDVTGDRAYAVVPANYSYKQNGKTVKETGSIFTVALLKSAVGWRITGWAWGKH